MAQPQANPTKTREETELEKRDKTRLESEDSHAGNHGSGSAERRRLPQQQGGKQRTGQ